MSIQGTEHALGEHHDWLIAEPVPPSFYRTVARDPRLDRATRAFAEQMLAVSAADPALGGIFKDGGRYVAAMCVAALHDGDITLPRLTALCAGFDLLSPGRVRALLLYMRYLGYVSLWKERGAGGPARYAISPAFLAAWRAHLKAALMAASILDPGFIVISRLDEDRFFEVFCRMQMEGLMRGAIAKADDLTTDNRLFRVLVNRHAGSQILWSIMVQGEHECPSHDPVRIMVSDFARRFEVSRMHVKRVMRDAEREGILIRLNEGIYRISESAGEELRLFYAMQLARLHMTFATTCAACGGEEEVRIRGAAA